MRKVKSLTCEIDYTSVYIYIYIYIHTHTDTIDVLQRISAHLHTALHTQQRQQQSDAKGTAGARQDPGWKGCDIGRHVCTAAASVLVLTCGVWWRLPPTSRPPPFGVLVRQSGRMPRHGVTNDSELSWNCSLKLPTRTGGCRPYTCKGSIARRKQRGKLPIINYTTLR